MIIRTTLSMILSAGMLMACGGSKPAAQAPVADKEHEHPKLPPNVDAFHNVMSPIWHAEPGAVRIKLACDQAGVLSEGARALVSDPPPPEIDGKSEVWKVATSELASQVGALVAACAAEGRLDVETKLAAVHEGFHKVGSTVAKMGDHGDHRPPGGTGQHGGPGEH